MHSATSDNVAEAPSFVGEDGVSLATVQEKPTTTTQQTTTFTDSENASTSVHSVRDQPSKVLRYADQSLGEFMSRPLDIVRGSWDVGTYLSEIIPIWYLYITNPAVQAKLSHFAYLRATINVKVMFNLTPFHYSHVLASYSPNPGFNLNHSLELYTDTTLLLNKASCLPNVIFDPATTSSIEMSFPMMLDENYVSLFDFIDLATAISQGNLNLHSTCPLRRANTTASDNVEFVVYAWLTDVDLTIPTDHNIAASERVKVGGNSFRTSVVPNKPKENRDGLVSSVSAVVANAAGALSSHPFMGSYMKPVHQAATTITDIAQYFGFSRPPVLTDRVYVKNTPFSSISVSNGPETVSKLSLDPLQTTAIGSSPVGLDIPEDELSILSIAQRPSLVYTTDWNTTYGADTILAYYLVDPLVMNIDPFDPSSTAYQLSPLAHACYPFQAWSGSIKLRIRLVASPYHRGRLRIAYNPDAVTPIDNTFPSNTHYSQILDISKDSDVEFIIPWAQASPYQRIYHERSERFSSVEPGVSSSVYFNGVVSVSVVSPLTAPDASANVCLNFYISAGDDFEVVGFEDRTTNISDFAGQAYPGTTPLLLAKDKETSLTRDPPIGKTKVVVEEELVAASMPVKMLFGETTQMTDVEDKKSIFFGEVFHSFRPLLKRYSDQGYRFADRVSNTNASIHSSISSHKLPLFYGFQEPSVILGAGEQGYERVTVLGFVYPYSSNDTSLMPYISSAFYCYRGSVRWKIQPVGGVDCPINHVSVHRGVEFSTLDSTDWYESGALSSTSTPTAYITNTQNLDKIDALMGAEIQPVISGVNGLEFEMPYYNIRRYTSTQVAKWGNVRERSIKNDAYTVNMTTAYGKAGTNNYRPGHRAFCAAGEDFDLTLYLGPPVLYVNNGAYTVT